MLFVTLLLQTLTVVPATFAQLDFSKPTKKVIFFENEYYLSKASEPQFCESVCATNSKRGIVYKPGRCPAGLAEPGYPARVARCVNECLYDSECDGGQRCCGDECSRRCTDPIFRKSCSDLTCSGDQECVEHPVKDARCVNTAPKEGFCPKIANNTGAYQVCSDECKYDEECDGNQKCCWNGCSQRCLKPRKADCDTKKCKVGFNCALDSQGVPKCLPIPCKQDGEVVDIECNSCTCIQGFLLCAQEECPPTKPGFCPRLVRGYRGKCTEDCTSDYQCEQDQKCCNTGCGHTCKQPAPEIIHPCRTVRFRCGDDTRCAATRGLCQPGKPCPLVPLCVSRRAPFCDSCPDGKVCVLQKQSCPSGHCQRQPICVQLYSDDTPFEENEQLEQEVVARQQLQHISSNRL